VGIGVDTDEHVEAFQCRLTLGSELVVDALAGVDLSEERVIEGTFWRDTAVEREEIEYLATGHPLVEALMNHVRDGDLGRATVARLREGPAGIGACFSYALQLPDPEDLAMGSHVPSRQAERLLDGGLFRIGAEIGSDGATHIRDQIVAMLDEGPRTQTVRPSELPLQAGRWEPVVRALETAARAEAERRLRAAVTAAAARLDSELLHRLDRLALDAERGDADERILRAAEMVQEQKFADSVRAALGAARLTLDSGCVVLREGASPLASRLLS
jgi:ATP-dependent helicase HepA